MAVEVNRSKPEKPDLGQLKMSEKGSTASLLKPVMTGLVISAGLELVLWRTFSRIGVFIPKKGTFQDIYKIVGLDLGSIFLNFSVILAVISLVLLVGRLREQGRFQSGASNARVMTVAVVAIIMVVSLTVLELFPRQEIPVISLLLRVSLLVAFGSLGIVYWRNHNSRLGRLFGALVVTAYGCQILAKLVEDRFLPLPGNLNPDNVYIPLLLVGEAAVLLNGLVLYPLYGQDGDKPARSIVRHWPAFLGAFVLASAFLALTFLTVAESDIVPILGLYALGYTMQLPLAMYVVALFFTMYVIFFNLGRLRKVSGARATAFGLILLLTGGYQFNISNQYLLALVGVWLLSQPEILDFGG